MLRPSAGRAGGDALKQRFPPGGTGSATAWNGMSTL